MLGEAAARRKSIGRELAGSSMPPLPGAGFPSPRRLSPRFPVELAALRGRLPDSTLRWAQRRGRALGVGGDEVLIHAGLISPETMAVALAAHLGVPLADLRRPLDMPADFAHGALRTASLVEPGPNGPHYVVAPRGKAVRLLAKALAEDPKLARRTALAAPENLRARLTRHARRHLARAAAYGLAEAAPTLSAATVPRGLALAAPLILFAAALIMVWMLAPPAVRLGVEAMLSAVFLAAMGLRLGACLMPETGAPQPVVEDRHLPVYTVIVPLYREAVMLPRLLAALSALDYPREKLDIKLVIEPDDTETRDAIAGCALPPCFEVVVAPPVGPRTKPKALNAALAFARGTFVAVFDAEDVPDPGQLRAALAAFLRGGKRVACVQARLAVDNAHETWISGHFALEYCAQFDVLLPALAAWRLPILLGGTSNHFLRHALDQAGGWDPYNVTEDADLGLRLSRMGWSIEVIASDTQEEAPVLISAWMRQRTRWMKGWGQTILVHGRNPRRLVRDLGARRAVVAGLLTIGPFVAMALIHPISLIVVAWDVWNGMRGGPVASTIEALISGLSYANLAFGYAVTAAINLVALVRRRRPRLRDAFVVFTIPFYWLLQTVAVWRAVIDLVVDPHRWDKTEHGVSSQRPAFGVLPTRLRS